MDIYVGAENAYFTVKIISVELCTEIILEQGQSLQCSSGLFSIAQSGIFSFSPLGHDDRNNK